MKNIKCIVCILIALLLTSMVYAQIEDSKDNTSIRLLYVKYINPSLIAELFGGYTIYGDETNQMGGNRGVGGRGRRNAGGISGGILLRKAQWQVFPRCRQGRVGQQYK